MTLHYESAINDLYGETERGRETEMAFKKVTVEFVVEDTHMEEMVRRSRREERDPESVTEISAFRDELQELLYDEGGMSGSFMILNVEDVKNA